jgi:hypothetical protein
MTRLITTFLRFWFDFIVGDDWHVAVAVAAALTLTYGTSTSGIPAWWILPATVAILLPLSLWRLARCRARSTRSDPAPR